MVGSSVGVMFEADLSGYGADATLTAGAQARAVSERAEVQILAVAAHWADLHGHLDLADGERGGSLPGMEQLVQLGGTGTPPVAEFAPAELGAVLAISPFAAARLVGDAVDLRHRLPLLWGAGAGRAGQAVDRPQGR